jgi:hypothetical protein
MSVSWHTVPIIMLVLVFGLATMGELKRERELNAGNSFMLMVLTFLLAALVLDCIGA